MTERTLTRRRLVVAGGTALFAGCGSTDAPEDDRFAPDNRQQSAPEAATPTAASDSTATETTTPEADSGETPTAESDEERSTETTPSGTESLSVAREHLTESVTVFLETGGGLTITQVDGSATDIDGDAVREELETAREHADRAAESPAVGDDEVEAVHRYADFVGELLRAQQAVADVYAQCGRAFESLAAEEIRDATHEITFLDDRVAEARDAVDRFRAETEPSDVDAVEVVTGEEYAEKLDQFEAELDGFLTLQDPLDRVASGLDDFGDGAEAYVSGRYDGAYKYFSRANQPFQRVDTELLTADAAHSAGDKLDALSDIVAALADGTDHLVESSQAGINNEDGRRRGALRSATSALSTPSFVDDLPSVQQLQDEE